RRLIKGSLVFVSVYLTCRIKFDFSSTLTTMTLYQCRLKGFASTYCKANAVGLPPSLAKLRKLFCRYATILFALGTPYKLSSARSARCWSALLNSTYSVTCTTDNTQCFLH